MPVVSHRAVMDNFVIYNLYGTVPSKLYSHCGMDHVNNLLIYDLEGGPIAAYHSNAFSNVFVLLKYPFRAVATYRKVFYLENSILRHGLPDTTIIRLPLPADPTNAENIYTLKQGINSAISNLSNQPDVLENLSAIDSTLDHASDLIDAYKYCRTFNVSQDKVLEDLCPVEAGMVMALWAILHGERIESTDLAEDCLQYIQRQGLYLVSRYALMQKQGNRSIHKGNIWDLMDTCRKYASDTGKLVDWKSASKHMAAIAYNLLTNSLRPYALYESQSVPVTYYVETDKNIIEEALHSTMGLHTHLDEVVDSRSSVAAVVATWNCPVCGKEHRAVVDSTRRIGLRTLWCTHLTSYWDQRSVLENPTISIKALNDEDNVEQVARDLAVTLASGYTNYKSSVISWYTYDLSRYLLVSDE
jgi:hypothetical protein